MAATQPAEEIFPRPDRVGAIFVFIDRKRLND